MANKKTFMEWCKDEGIFAPDEHGEKADLYCRFLLEEAGKNLDKTASNILSGSLGKVTEQVRQGCEYLLEQGTIYAVCKSNYELYLSEQ